MLQIKIEKETENSFQLMKGALDSLHIEGEKAELTFVKTWDKVDRRTLLIFFASGVIFGLMMGLLWGLQL